MLLAFGNANESDIASNERNVWVEVYRGIATLGLDYWGCTYGEFTCYLIYKRQEEYDKIAWHLFHMYQLQMIDRTPSQLNPYSLDRKVQKVQVEQFPLLKMFDRVKKDRIKKGK